MSDSTSRIGRWIAGALALLVFVVIFINLVADNMPKGDVREVADYTPWAPETLIIAETLPVQNGGRIKPLSSYAGFTMLGLHGARSMEIQGADGKKIKLKPIAWVMDALFRPQLAVNLPTFRIDNSDVVQAMGVKPRGKRDRYSYADLIPGRQKLNELAKSYEAIEKEKRDIAQTQTLDLAANVSTFESLIGYFGFARNGVILEGSGIANTPDRRSDVSLIMATLPEITKQLEDARHSSSQVHPHLQSMLSQILELSNFARAGLFILPPADRAQRTWLSAGDTIMGVMNGSNQNPTAAINEIRTLETTARAIQTGDAAFAKEFTALHDSIVKRAADRGEGRRVPLEAEYYRKNWFLNALVFFILGTLGSLCMWAMGQGKAGRIAAIATLAFTCIGLGLCIVAIVKRCVIMQRPPVGNLYDTVIFIGATVVLLALIVEWMVRRRFALGIAPMLGMFLIVLARRYELGDAKDHMDPLVAVLDSNFWLTTHVITITLGYSAGLLSAFLSSIYILMRGLGLDNGDRDLRRTLTRTVYGMICLTLFLSLVGTVLGGIWANYSWGRFWGWDPKENGALLIVLWTLAILHARLGGYLREWGLHFASIFTACVVTFSWWHVNFLGVGLHNYGFTAGKGTIWVFYCVVLAMLGFGVVAMFLESSSTKQKVAHAPND